jgi:cytochrome P450
MATLDMVTTRREDGAPTFPNSAPTFPESKLQGLVEFDPNDLKQRTKIGFGIRMVRICPNFLLWLLRCFWPVARIPCLGLTIVSRYDHVQEVLERDDVFEVPFGPRVQELNGGPNFLLGMAEGPDYWNIQSQVMAAFRRDDVDRIVTPLAAELSAAILEKGLQGGKGRIDAVQDLITRVPTLIAECYYGIHLDPDRRVAFAHWTFAMSSYMFGDLFNDPGFRHGAIAGAHNVRAVVNDSIERARRASSARPGGAVRPDDTVLSRLVAPGLGAAAGLSNLNLASYLIGMITGFVPTNTMAAGNMLETLFKHRKFMKAAVAAAREGDDKKLWRVLRETSRFMPINPGPFRNCTEGYEIAAGTTPLSRIPRGAKVLASTQSAMFDARRVAHPWRFDPERNPADYMIFGHGLHWCLGALIAEAQITQTMKALLLRKGLRRAPGKAGRLRRLGQFPQHLEVEYDA